MNESIKTSSALRQLISQERSLRCDTCRRSRFQSSQTNSAALCSTKRGNCRFGTAKKSVGSGTNIVLQRMTLQNKLSSTSTFGELAREFQNLFGEAIDGQGFFAEPVIFNDWMLQKYEIGKIGITPHRDHTNYRNIVCLFVLTGHGSFCVSDDRERSNQQEIANMPGDVILMAAPGFIGLKRRTFHYLEDIRRERYVFGLRQDQTKMQVYHKS